jgi:hypothetical protein
MEQNRLKKRAKILTQSLSVRNLSAMRTELLGLPSHASLLQHLALERLCLGCVDLETSNSRSRRQPVRARGEARAENDELVAAVPDRRLNVTNLTTNST